MASKEHNISIAGSYAYVYSLQNILFTLANTINLNLCNNS